MRCSVGLSLLACSLSLAGDPPKGATGPPDPPKAKKAYAVVFDFQSPQLNDAGAELSRSVFGKLARQKLANIEMIDPLTARESAEKYNLDFDVTPARLASVLAGELAANLAVVGQLTRDGAAFTARVRVLDLRANADDWLWDKTFTATGERARGLLADQITQAISGLAVAKPLEVGFDPEPAKLGPTVSVNGDFETGQDGQPAGWQPVDNLTTFWVDDPAGKRGKILRINTDVLESQWQAWAAKLAGGARPADAPKPLATKDPKYDTVAGNHGVQVFNDDVPCKRGMRYRVLADFKGKTDDFFFAKVFVKGYAKFASKDETVKEQYREVWRTYLALRNFDTQWKHYSQTLQPAEQVEKLRIIVYAYWPPGVYEFDNVRLVEEPRSATQPAGK